MILKKCNGCGAILQDIEEDKPGFVPKLTTESEYCRRCFRMKHYNELPKIVATNKDYENVISVTGPLSSYHLYFNEVITGTKNVGEENFKSDSIINGKIDTLDNTYSFDGKMAFRNNKTKYETTVVLANYKIDIVEVFGIDNNEFTYSFYDNDLKLIKEIYIKQKLDNDGSIRALEFKNQYTTINVEKKNVSQNSPIEFKVDSRNNMVLTVSKENNNYKYNYKNKTINKDFIR